MRSINAIFSVILEQAENDRSGDLAMQAPIGMLMLCNFFLRVIDIKRSHHNPLCLEQALKRSYTCMHQITTTFEGIYLALQLTLPFGDDRCSQTIAQNIGCRARHI